MLILGLVSGSTISSRIFENQALTIVEGLFLEIFRKIACDVSSELLASMVPALDEMITKLSERK